MNELIKVEKSLNSLCFIRCNLKKTVGWWLNSLNLEKIRYIYFFGPNDEYRFEAIAKGKSTITYIPINLKHQSLNWLCQNNQKNSKLLEMCLIHRPPQDNFDSICQGIFFQYKLFHQCNSLLLTTWLCICQLDG